MINNSVNKYFFMVLFSIAAVLLFAWYSNINCNYPYYFIWDMDHHTTVDTVLIQSDLLPDHTCHPGFGMNLIFVLSERMAHLMGSISSLTLSDLSVSLNPAACMAELTDYLRRHSPYLSIATVLFLCFGLQLIFNLPTWFLMVVIGVFGLQESFSYQSAMVRTELYSLFYWSFAVLMASASLRFKGFVKRQIFLVIGGILAGLCFMAKMQSLFYLAALLIFWIIGSSLLCDERESVKKVRSKGNKLFIFLASIFSFFIFLTLILVSYNISIPKGIPLWAKSFGIRPLAVIFLIGFLFLLIIQFINYRKDKSSDIYYMFSMLSVVGFGFILSFGMYFLVYGLQAGLSLKYLLITFKMVFLREPERLLIPKISDYISNFAICVKYNPTIFLVNIVFFLILLLGHFKGFVKLKKKELVLLILVFFIAYLNIMVGTRLILRDNLWREVIINFLSLFCFGIILGRSDKGKKKAVQLSAVLFVLIILANINHLRNIRDRLDANFNHYGWQKGKVFDGVYKYNQIKYHQLMHQRYDATTAWIGARMAVEHKKIREVADFVFKNQEITHKNIGVAFEGFSVWSDSLDYKIVEVPPALRGDIVVDSQSVPLGSKHYFKEECVTAHNEYSDYLDKFKKGTSPKKLVILPRVDLRILLFVSDDDVRSLLSERITETPYSVILRNESSSKIGLKGLLINNYCELDVGKIKKNYFFVIHEI
ncbi:MAG: hypothetical protein ACMUIL_03565 [bacterium]